MKDHIRRSRLQATDPMADGAGVDVINGVAIDLESPLSFTVGLAAGL
jgi:hypothetical protein